MKRIKLSITAIAAVAAAGVAGAGSVFINGQSVGSFSGDVILRAGDVHFASATINGSGGNTSGGNQEPAPDPDPVDPVDPAPANCTGVAPAGAARDSSLTSFAQFPGFQGDQFEFNLQGLDYVAASFTAPAAGYAGNLDIGVGFRYPSGTSTVAFSQCPGDFTQTLPQGPCISTGGVHKLWFSTRGSQDVSVACVLTPGETYYFNAIYASPSNFSIKTCDSSICGQLVAWRLYYEP